MKKSTDIRLNKKIIRGLPSGRLCCLDRGMKEVNGWSTMHKNKREESFKQSVKCLVETELLPDKADLLHTHQNMADLS